MNDDTRGRSVRSRRQASRGVLASLLLMTACAAQQTTVRPASPDRAAEPPPAPATTPATQPADAQLATSPVEITPTARIPFEDKLRIAELVAADYRALETCHARAKQQADPNAPRRDVLDPWASWEEASVGLDITIAPNGSVVHATSYKGLAERPAWIASLTDCVLQRAERWSFAPRPRFLRLWLPIGFDHGSAVRTPFPATEASEAATRRAREEFDLPPSRVQLPPAACIWNMVRGGEDGTHLSRPAISQRAR